MFGSGPYFLRSSSIKPSCSRTELIRCTATEIRWNKNKEARTSPVVSTNRLPNLLKNRELKSISADWAMRLHRNRDKITLFIICTSALRKTVVRKRREKRPECKNAWRNTRWVKEVLQPSCCCCRNLINYWPIFKILSPTHSAEKLH